MTHTDCKRLAKNRRNRRRRGAYLVLFALSMTVFLGILALVYDLALLNYYSKDCQNIADAAATAGARELAKGNSNNIAVSKSIEYLTILNQTDSTASDVRLPPSSGPYIGKDGYIEVTARKSVKTWFVRAALLGPSSLVVTARSVAGADLPPAQDTIISLNTAARPGIAIASTSFLRVEGSIMANSNGGGKDEKGDPINNGSNGYAVTVGTSISTPRGIFAKQVNSVGGVDYPQQIQPFDPSDALPLKTRVSIRRDPFSNLPTPVQSNGVDSRLRGLVQIASTVVTGLSEDASGQNRIAVQGESIANGLYIAQQGDVILHPGIYKRIWISGKRVFFVPGIYVFTPNSAVYESFRVTGGVVIANGVLFYNTGANYSSITGSPDISDLETPPPSTPTTTFAATWLTQVFRPTPIDTKKYDYSTLYPGAQTVSSVFDGLVFHQRRHNTANMQITGSDTTTYFEGAIYGKWMKLTVSGKQLYRSKWIVDNLFVSGGSEITITPLTPSTTTVNTVAYLVE